MKAKAFTVWMTMRPAGRQAVHNGRVTMEKVLLLSGSTGQGHNSCAQAVKEYFEGKDIQCEVLDSLNFISEGFGRFMSWGHSFMYRHIPGLFRWGYN